MPKDSNIFKILKEILKTSTDDFVIEIHKATIVNKGDHQITFNYTEINNEKNNLILNFNLSIYIKKYNNAYGDNIFLISEIYLRVYWGF